MGFGYLNKNKFLNYSYLIILYVCKKKELGIGILFSGMPDICLWNVCYVYLTLSSTIGLKELVETLTQDDEMENI